MSRGPRAPSAAELQLVGVTIVSENPFQLRCDTCQAIWSPAPPASGLHLRLGYWKCPNGCNKEAR